MTTVSMQELVKVPQCLFVSRLIGSQTRVKRQIFGQCKRHVFIIVHRAVWENNRFTDLKPV